MDLFQGITVQVISNQQTLKLYDGPEADDPRVRQHYVEAIPGTTFEVQVTLTKVFNLHQKGINEERNDGLSFTVIFDERSPSIHISSFNLHIHEELVKKYAVRYTFECMPHFDPETGQWLQRNFSFGGFASSISTPFTYTLNTVLTMPADESPNSTLTLPEVNGTVRVCVQRVEVKKLSQPEPPTNVFSTTAEVLETTPKGRAISNVVR
ncbi:hypothetical protein MMC28_004897 [Mycoblastus sanguinarius]|nr:hypothetical protein [Mycoblastus sanguinarius]